MHPIIGQALVTERRREAERLAGRSWIPHLVAFRHRDRAARRAARTGEDERERLDGRQRLRAAGVGVTSVLPVPDVRLEAAERSGYRDFWEATPPGLAARLGMAHAEVGAAHLTAVAAAPGVRVLNHVLGVPGDGPIDPDELAAIERFYAARGLPALLALPAGAPGEAQLAARGYERDYAWVKFSRDLAPAPAVACDLAVRPVAREDARRMGALLVPAFGLPADSRRGRLVMGRAGWHVLGAYEGAELVATGSLWVDGDAGWLTWAATDPAHRGRRAQRALLAARIELARGLGLERVVVETGEQEAGRPDASYRNILWAGFREAYVRPFWRLGPESSRP